MCSAFHRLSHEPSLDKFKRTQIVPSIFSNNNGMKLELGKLRNSVNICQYLETFQYTSEWSVYQQHKSVRKFFKILYLNKVVSTTCCKEYKMLTGKWNLVTISTLRNLKGIKTRTWKNKNKPQISIRKENKQNFKNAKYQ